MPVRMGGPQNVTGLTEVVRNPIHSTGVGLLMYGKDHQILGRGIDSDGLGWFSKMKNWFQGNF
jgi:cell division protein FtsA